MKLIFRGGYIIEDIARKDIERTPKASETDIATSLLERDCKGLGNYSNGVIEIYEVDDGSHTDRKHNAVKMGRAD